MILLKLFSSIKLWKDSEHQYIIGIKMANNKSEEDTKVTDLKVIRKKCDQLIFKGVLFCLLASHIQHKFVDPCGGKVSGNCQYCKWCHLSLKHNQCDVYLESPKQQDYFDLYNLCLPSHKALFFHLFIVHFFFEPFLIFLFVFFLNI